MLGYKLVPEAALQLSEDRLTDLRNLLDKMESELHYWRERADDERARADRVSDLLNQSNGLPDVTPTVIREKKQVQEKVQASVDKHEAELAEMFSESFDSEDELNWVDPDLREAAAGWMETAKKARDAKKESHAL